METTAKPLASWFDALVRAVDADNHTPDASCRDSATFAALLKAPAGVCNQVALAIEDFSRTGHQPLRALRADAVAERFRVITGGPNVLVARMTVPGGPWPGHYGLEAFVFDAHLASLPTWFPSVGTGDQQPLHFASALAASRAFSSGSGCVVFPELLSVTRRQPVQTFGVVFLDKLTSLFATDVLPVVASDELTALRTEALKEYRELAFLAHEWGHLAGLDLEQTLLVARCRRCIAVISELHADLAAIGMLLRTSTESAVIAATVLVLDRILREAWLVRPGAQVDSIASRQLLRILLDTGALHEVGDGRLSLRLDAVLPRIDEEAARVGAVEQQCTPEDVQPALDYLVSYGWTIDADRYRLDFDDPIVANVILPARRPSVSPGTITGAA